MKNRTLYVLITICCLCLFSTSSKECGKIVNDKTTAESQETHPCTEKKTEVPPEMRTEFSLLNAIFFQTT